MNVRDVTFIGAAGLHVLDDAAQALGARGRLVLLDPSNVVVRAVKLIGLDDAVHIVTPERNRHVA